MKPLSALIILIFVLHLVSFSSYLSAQQSNFSISPPPVPYPYFDDGRTDVAVDGSYISLSASEMTMTGGFIDLNARQALSRMIAFDLNTGIGAMTGSMPGIPPAAPIYTNGAYSYVPYFTRASGRSSLTFMNLMLSGGAELQPIRSDIIDMIFFGGLTMTYSQLTMTTPYELIVPPPYSNAGTTYTGYRNTLTVESMLYGYQAGIQIDLTLSENLRLSPFLMMSTTSGTATMTENPGVSTAKTTSTGVTIPASTSYSFGMDILLGNISIGTVLQQLQSSNQKNGKAKIIMISAGYHFNTDIEEADNQ